MNTEKLCELCEKPMRKIGPFAARKLEGQPSKQFDGKFRFECVQEECPSFNKVIELDEAS